MNRLEEQVGFTLIELVIVLIMIGILAAVAVPKFTGVSSRGVRMANHQIALQIHAAIRAQTYANAISDTRIVKSFHYPNEHPFTHVEDVSTVDFIVNDNWDAGEDMGMWRITRNNSLHTWMFASPDYAGDGFGASPPGEEAGQFYIYIYGDGALLDGGYSNWVTEEPGSLFPQQDYVDGVDVGPCLTIKQCLNKG